MRLSSKSSQASVRLVYLAVSAVGALMLFPTASAQAAPITLGQTSSTGNTCTSANPYTEIQTTSAGGGSYTVPTGGGTIVSWSHYANTSTKTKLRLKVYRPTANPDVFTVVGESALETIVPKQLNTFATDIPVQVGDVLGYTRSANSEMLCLFSTTSAEDVVADAPGSEDSPGANTTFHTPFFGYERINISAVLESPPGIGSLSPTSGSIVGGTSVTITGHDFTGATAVKFGNAPASSFTVNSDSQVTAVAPPSTAPGAVDVTVTTAAGTTATVPADHFTYESLPRETSTGGPRPCIVPKLKGKTLKSAKKALGDARCKLGKVKGKMSKTAKVKSQSPKTGTVLAPGSKVSVKVR